jgi:hypothetical protein
MARVKIETETGQDEWGGSCVSTVYRLYCDRCGSFHIAPHLSPARSVLLVLLTATAAWFWLRRQVCGPVWLAYLIMFFSLVLPILYASWTHLGHKCLRCGNTHISRRDALHYGELGQLPVDVPAHGPPHEHNQVSDEPYFPLIVIVLALVLILPATALFVIWLVVAGIYQACSALLALRKTNQPS